MPILRVAGLVAGVAGAAALGAGAASGATATASASYTAPKVAACSTSQLRVWYGQPTGAAAGTFYIPLQFSDVGGASCALYGYPGVSGVTAGGAQLGTPAGWDSVIPPRTVVLAPGGTAHVLLRITDVANYPSTACKPTGAYGLRVYPPNQKASVVVPFAFEACGKSGPTYLHVDPVNAGVGIPLYSNS